MLSLPSHIIIFGVELSFISKKILQEKMLADTVPAKTLCFDSMIKILNYIPFTVDHGI